MSELAEIGANVITLIEMRLESERANDSDEIGIAAAFANAIDCALDLAHACINCGQ